jgi:cytochrome b561
MVPISAYSKGASAFHWLAAAPIIGCIGTVLAAQNAPKEEKGKWMHRHKSLGLLTGMIIAPRFAYRLISSQSYRVQHLVGNKAWENTAGDASHLALYGFMTIMPATGIAMGYYGGKGLPFFGTTFTGSVPANDDEKKANGQIAKSAFWYHKQLGTYGKYLVPLHVGAAVSHSARGQAIFSRINPFRVPRG